MIEYLPWMKSIEELERWQTSHKDPQNENEKRSKIKIAVVDDQPFSSAKNLRSVGYQISELGDLKSVKEIEEYHIILCDIQGVGSAFDSSLEGGFLIDEIKRNYPDRFVIAYTGGTLNPNTMDFVQAVADEFVRKDADVNEWRAKLDRIIEEILDPVRVWRRQREVMVERNVDTKSILRVEHAFVDAILGKSQTAYVSLVNSSKLPQDVRAIGQSLIASGIFKYFVG